jgi:hypothetical protein
VVWLGPGAVVAAPSWMEQRPHVLTKPVIKVVDDEQNKDDFETYSVTIVMTLFFLTSFISNAPHYFCYCLALSGQLFLRHSINFHMTMKSL